MKPWRYAALSLALLASQGLAENWVTVSTNHNPNGSFSVNVDKDSIRRGSDGLVYYSVDDQGDIRAQAGDCHRRLVYLIRGGGETDDISDWRAVPNAAWPGSIDESELNYVCANAR